MTCLVPMPSRNGEELPHNNSHAPARICIGPEPDLQSSHPVSFVTEKCWYSHRKTDGLQFLTAINQRTMRPPKGLRLIVFSRGLAKLFWEALLLHFCASAREIRKSWFEAVV